MLTVEQYVFPLAAPMQQLFRALHDAFANLDPYDIHTIVAKLLDDIVDEASDSGVSDGETSDSEVSDGETFDSEEEEDEKFPVDGVIGTLQKLDEESVFISRSRGRCRNHPAWILASGDNMPDPIHARVHRVFSLRSTPTCPVFHNGMPCEFELSHFGNRCQYRNVHHLGTWSMRCGKFDIQRVMDLQQRIIDNHINARVCQEAVDLGVLCHPSAKSSVNIRTIRQWRREYLRLQRCEDMARSVQKRSRKAAKKRRKQRAKERQRESKEQKRHVSQHDVSDDGIHGGDNLPDEPVEAEECCVCLDADVATRFIPCGHAITCIACCTKIVQTRDPVCIICRAAIESTVLVMKSFPATDAAIDIDLPEEDDECLLRLVQMRLSH